MTNEKIMDTLCEILLYADVIKDGDKVTFGHNEDFGTIIITGAGYDLAFHYGEDIYISLYYYDHGKLTEIVLDNYNHRRVFNLLYDLHGEWMNRF